MEFRAYIACLASYNNGTLHGEWIDLDGQSVDDIQEEITRILAESDAEEYVVHDWEGCDFGEHPNWAEVVEYVEMAAAISRQYTTDAFLAYQEFDAYEPSVSDFEDRFRGVYDSPEDWAREFVNDVYDLQEPLANYFDYEAFARDAQAGGDIVFIYQGDGCFVFWAH